VIVCSYPSARRKEMNRGNPSGPSLYPEPMNPVRSASAARKVVACSALKAPKASRKPVATSSAVPTGLSDVDPVAGVVVCNPGCVLRISTIASTPIAAATANAATFLFRAGRTCLFC